MRWLLTLSLMTCLCGWGLPGENTITGMLGGHKFIPTHVDLFVGEIGDANEYESVDEMRVWYYLDLVKVGTARTPMEYMVIWFTTEAGAQVDGLKPRSKLMRSNGLVGHPEPHIDVLGGGPRKIDQVVWGRFWNGKQLSWASPVWDSVTIEFGQSKNGWVPVSIDLKCAQGEKTYLRGVFLARIRHVVSHKTNGACSNANRTPIPIQIEHSFQSKTNARSNRK